MPPFDTIFYGLGGIGVAAYAVKRIVDYFVNNAEYMVKQNQENIDKFLERLNHQETANREIHERQISMLAELKETINKNTAIAEHVLQRFEKNHQL